MMKTNSFLLFVTLTISLFSFQVKGQTPQTISNEKDVPPYTLPDPLVMANGEKILSTKTWNEKRRPEILSMFTSQMYGKTPEKKLDISFELISEDKNALKGKATRKEVIVYFTKDKKGPSMVILLYLPNQVKGKIPVFLGLNFDGNHTLINDPAISLPKSWVENNAQFHINDHKANEERRGAATSQWAVEKILNNGYGIASIYDGDIEPDFYGGINFGVRSLFFKEHQTRPEPDEWGAIGAWAWGLSRAMDYFESSKEIDSRRIAVFGHSRLGKAALWAAVQDQRFAIVISNNSGCGGAALSKRIFGETVKIINDHFPHWFCENFKQYNNNENALPFDQHMLISLIAPRPVYIASAESDLWADPQGEFLSALYASPVYKLLGTDGLATTKRPEVNQPVFSTIGYHIRPGKHDVTDYDWEMYIKFADKYMK